MIQIGSDVIAKIPQIGEHAFTLYCYLADLAGTSGRCTPSYEMMCAGTGIGSNHTISTSLKILAGVGLIKIKRRYSASSEVFICAYSAQQDSYTTTSLINLNKEDIKQSICAQEAHMEEQSGEITPFQVLSDAFTNTTGIQFYDPPRWIDAVNFMLRQNVTPDDIETSFREIKDKYPVHGPWSLQKSALQVKTKRNGNGRGPKIDPRNIPVEEY